MCACVSGECMCVGGVGGGGGGGGGRGRQEFDRFRELSFNEDTAVQVHWCRQASCLTLRRALLTALTTECHR